jgi:hypothetical protein
MELIIIFTPHKYMRDLIWWGSVVDYHVRIQVDHKMYKMLDGVTYTAVMRPIRNLLEVEFNG